MKRGSRTALIQKALAWLVLALFVLAFIVFFGHIGCCHGHDGPDGFCPFCEAFIQYARLLRLAGLAGAASVLLSILRAAGPGGLLRRAVFSPKPTLVSLRVKLSD